jgi:two-component system NarL family sensor kinase
MLLGLRPKSLDGTSLVGALKALAQRHAGEWRIMCKFRFIGQETGLSADVQDEFYRIAQEALCNVHKHSHATSVSIILNYKLNDVALTVRDNGQGFANKPPKTISRGFEPSLMRECDTRIGGSMDTIRNDLGLSATASRETKASFGLATMRERAQRIGGELEIKSPKKGGTSIRVQVPLAKAGQSI